MKRTQKKIKDESVPVADNDNSLSERQEQALQAVISHPTLKEAALAVGISETTLWRYMQEEAFNRRLRQARRDAVDHAVIRLQRASSDAVSVLRDLMMKEDAPAAARISAARTVLDYSFRIVEIDELKTRMEDLENFLRIREKEYAIDAAKPEEGNQ
jgi:hypothetical protein